MLDLSRKLKDELELGDVVYPLNLAFNNVLKLFEMFRDEEVPEFVKPHLALRILTGEKFPNLSVEQAVGIMERIFEEHIQLESAKEVSVEYDLAGNVMVSSRVSQETEPPVYDIRYDGDYIYASFMQAYGIDLFEVQGRLHWKAFNALLAGLPEGTKFVEVVKIRKYQPQKGESQDYKASMMRLKKEYALPGQVWDDDEEDDDMV